jgi:hypothetical protein
MSIRQDYIVRLARRAGVVLKKALGLRAAGQQSECRAELSGAFRELTGLDLGLAQALSTADLLPLLMTSGESDPAKRFLAALLLNEAGAPDQARALWATLDDFRFLEPMDADLKLAALAAVDRTADERLAALAAALRGEAFPPGTK